MGMVGLEMPAEETGSRAALVNASAGRYNPPNPNREDKLDDRELLDAIAAGDVQALEEFISRYERRLAGFLRVLLADSADVEEALWETVTQVWKCAANFQGRSKPDTWVLGIARNVAFGLLRKFRRHNPVPLDPDQPDQRPGQEERCFHAELGETMRLLTAEHREVLLYFYWLGHNSREISEMLEIPPPTVRTRLHHARKNLKRLLGLESGQAEAGNELDSNKDDDDES